MRWVTWKGRHFLVSDDGRWYEIPPNLALHLHPVDSEDEPEEEDPEDHLILSFGAAFAAGLTNWRWHIAYLEYRLNELVEEPEVVKEPELVEEPKVVKEPELVEGVRPEPVLILDRSGLWQYSLASNVASKLACIEMAGAMSEGIMSPDAWYRWMREEIKRETIRQYLLGIGGRHMMTPAHWGRIGGLLKSQYVTYLDRFYQQVLAGELSDAQIAARSQYYINSAARAYHLARAQVAKAAGFDEELWVIDFTRENCPDCLAFAAEEWKPIGHFPIPRDGSTQCLFNCYCHKRYRKGRPLGGHDLWDG